MGGGGGVLYEIPSVVGVWIFSGTTQYCRLYVLAYFHPNTADYDMYFRLIFTLIVYALSFGLIFIVIL